MTKSSPVFRRICEDAAEEDARALWINALRADQIAKIAINGNGDRLYQQTGRLLSGLYRMGCLCIQEVQITASGLFLSVAFNSDEYVRIMFHQLDSNIQDSVAAVVMRLLMEATHEQADIYEQGTH